MRNNLMETSSHEDEESIVREEKGSKHMEFLVKTGELLNEVPQVDNLLEE